MVSAGHSPEFNRGEMPKRTEKEDNEKKSRRKTGGFES
jgi:hypothetical protein